MTLFQSMSCGSSHDESSKEYKTIPSIFLTDVEQGHVENGGNMTPLNMTPPTPHAPRTPAPPSSDSPDEDEEVIEDDSGLAEEEAACLADLDQALSGENTLTSLSSDQRDTGSVDGTLTVDYLDSPPVSLRVGSLDFDVGANYTFKGIESPCSTLKGSISSICKVL